MVHCINCHRDQWSTGLDVKCFQNGSLDPPQFVCDEAAVLVVLECSRDDCPLLSRDKAPSAPIVYGHLRHCSPGLSEAHGSPSTRGPLFLTLLMLILLSPPLTTNPPQEVPVAQWLKSCVTNKPSSSYRTNIAALCPLDNGTKYEKSCWVHAWTRQNEAKRSRGQDFNRTALEM